MAGNRESRVRICKGERMEQVDDVRAMLLKK